jgi:beta-glucosidase
MIKASDFGKDFLWGVATAAPQIEGASQLYGKGASIWDTFSARSGKIKKGHKLDIACDFYHQYHEDIALVKLLGFEVFRFSIAWTRILPTGRGEVNQEGIRFYHNVIDECLTQGIVPYVTLYHWDLPQALEDEGGWTSFSINAAFNSFVSICAKEYGDKVKLNEPFGFTSLGYMLGIHALEKADQATFFLLFFIPQLRRPKVGRS